MKALRFLSSAVVASVILATGSAWAEFGKGVPGLYQKIYSGSDVTTGDPEDGGVIIAAGAGLLAVASGSPSISYTDPVTSTKYTLGESRTVAYKGVMKMEAGKTYRFAKSFDDTGHIRITSPDGTVNNVLDSTSWAETKYGDFTPTETGYHTLLIYCGNGGGSVGPAAAPFNNAPCASIMWNDVGLTSCTAANKSQWHRLINDDDGDTLGVYLYTDVPDSDCPEIEIRGTTVSADGKVTVSFVLTEGKGDISVKAVDSDGAVKSVSVGSAISASETELSGVITGLEEGRSYALNIHTETAAGFKYDCEAGSAYFGEVSVAAGANAETSTLTPGTFVISRPSDNESVRLPLEVRYSCSGATAETHYVMLSDAVVIPAGEKSVTIRAWPLPSEVGDRDLTLTLEPVGRSFVGAANAATISILGPSAAQEVRFVSNAGDDANDGQSLGTAFRSLRHAIDSVAERGAATIVVVPGLYETTDRTAVVDSYNFYDNHYVITNALTVLGLGDRPENTHFKGPRDSKSPSRVFYMNNADSKLKNLLISGGCTSARSAQDGGANVCIYSGGGTVEDCVISNGWCESWQSGGGGIQMWTGRVTRTTFTCNGGNNQDYNGLGAHLRMYGGHVENCLFTKNDVGTTIKSYGLIHMSGSSTLSSCTVAGNHAKACAAVILESANCRVYNTVISGNKVDSDATGHDAVYKLKGSATIGQFVNCVADCELGPTCTRVDFAGFADETTYDFHLGASSVCRDTGDESLYVAPQAISPTDLDGNLRMSGEKRGTALDIGCYEFDTSGLSIDVTVDNPVGLMDYDGGLLPGEASFHIIKNGGSGTATYSWDFEGDGVVDLVTHEVDVVHGYAAVGTYSVIVSATDDSGTVVVKKTNIFSAAPKTIYVDATSANPVAPYVTRETAAKTVADAYAAALDGSRILVAPGVYKYSDQKSCLNVQTAVTISGEGSSPEAVVFTNDSYSADTKANGTFFQLMNADAWIGNVLFVDCFNYSMSDSSGGGITLMPGTASNCVFRHCGCHNSRAGGAAVKSGLVTHSIFENCYNRNTTGRRFQAAHVSGTGRIENSLFRDMHSNSSVICLEGSGTSMKNCTVVDCSVTYSTGNNLNGTSIPERFDGAAIEVTSSHYSFAQGCGKIYNTAIANVSRSSYETYKSGGAGIVITNTMPATNCANWIITYVYNNWHFPDTIKTFDHCATEDETPINDTCFTGTAQNFFRDAVHGDYRPNIGGILRNNGVTLEEQEQGTDLAGHPRVFGRSVDIGCYECTAGGIKLIIR